MSQNILNYKHPLHPINEDLKPILSAQRKGFKRIAIERFNKLVKDRNMMRWEMYVVLDVVRDKLKKEGITG